MKEEFKAGGDQGCRRQPRCDWSKNVDERCFRPQIEAEREKAEQGAALSRVHGIGRRAGEGRSPPSETRDSGRANHGRSMWKNGMALPRGLEPLFSP